MKRSAVVLLCAILALSSAACGKTGPDVPRQTEAMYRTYEYAYGNLNIQLPEDADDPEDKGTSLLFTDPENLWTLELKPLDVQNTKMEISNLDSQITPEHAYFKDVQENEDPYQDFAAHFWSLNFNMDNPGGMSMYYNEPKAFQVIDYGDTLVGQWGGLKLELTGLNKETQIQDILADSLVRCIWDHLSFQVTEGGGLTENVGISAEFPARWNNTIKETGICTNFQGDRLGYLSVTAVKPADPEEAAALCQDDIEEMDFGGLHYYVTVKTFGDGEDASEHLRLYTKFTDDYAVCVEMASRGLVGDELWELLDDENISNILNSIKLDPSGFKDPELKYTNADGFKCNEIGYITEYTGTAEEVILPQTIGDVTISDMENALFKGHTEIKSVIIPEGYEVISREAFKDCTSLERVEIASSVTYISTYAFEGCTALKEVVFNEGLTGIAAYAFDGCTALGDITLPSSTVAVGAYAFRNTSMDGATFICKGNAVFDTWALAESGFKTVQFLGNCDLSIDAVLAYAKVENLTIGEGTEVLGSNFASTDFGETTPLTVSLPESLKEIGDGATFICKGNAVFDTWALAESGFKTVQFLGNCDLSIDAVLAYAKVENLTIGEGTEVLGSNFASTDFGETTPLTVSLPESLKEIGDGAFSQREGLTEIDLKNVEVIGEDAFSYTGLRELLIPGTVKEVGAAFDSCIQLKTIRVSEGVEAIGDEAFSFAGNGNGSEGEYVTYLTDEEYEKNKAYVYQEDEKAGFVNVYLPSTLKRVGANVFYGAYVDGIYMEWCTSPDALPSFDPTFVEDKLAGIHQIYFTKETIDAYGDELDAYFMNTNAKDCCWYPNGQKAYWSSQSLE